MLFFIPFLVISLSFAESQQKELNFGKYLLNSIPSSIKYSTTLSVIYYQPDQQDIPFITEEMFKELNSHKDILRTYHPFNNKESLETFQTNREYENHKYVPEFRPQSLPSFSCQSARNSRLLLST